MSQKGRKRLPKNSATHKKEHWKIAAQNKKGLTFPMHKLTNKQYEAYMKMIRDRDAGRLLTPDGLRLICSANEYNPEKIGIHMLTVLANWNKT